MQAARTTPTETARDDRHRWSLTQTPAAAWEAMLAACAGARHSIEFEQYILTPTPIGQRFLDLLSAKARDGVRVRLLLDTIGSWPLFRSEAAARAAASGIEIRWYNRPRLSISGRIYRLARRDHIKLLIVDGRTAFTGGVCVDQRMAGWRDTMLCLQGPLLPAMQQVFERAWAEPKPRRKPKPVPDHVFRGGDMVLSVDTSSGQERPIYGCIHRALRTARERIDLTTPYFVPAKRFLRLLGEAVDRGVQVRLIVPGAPDHPFVDAVAGSFYADAMRMGVRVFRLRGRMMHAKTIVADDSWAMIGSTNFDYISFFGNREIALESGRSDFVAAVSGCMSEDLAASEEISPAAWRRRPFRQRSAGAVGRVFKRYL